MVTRWLAKPVLMIAGDTLWGKHGPLSRPLGAEIGRPDRLAFREGCEANGLEVLSNDSLTGRTILHPDDDPATTSKNARH